tara:strand:- start:5152 stop:5394 length:243 start_codon:yes stop_codon:yes gene_type:complete
MKNSFRKGCIIVKWLGVSYAKRREIFYDGFTAASMRQKFASETPSHLTIILFWGIALSVRFLSLIAVVYRSGFMIIYAPL